MPPPCVFCLYPLERRVSRHGPTPGKVAVGVRPANVIDASNLGCQILGHHVVWTHGVDETVWAAFLTGPIVRKDKHQRVVQLA